MALAPRRSDRGQVTIFLAVTTIVIMGLIAFVVNVGLFVKAKINLQNAVDAAAWSGAAVQARQLTNIGYLNWELHNTYKEWMFKYYVLGQASLNHTHQNDGNFPGFNNPNMNYRARVFNGNTSDWDPYNVPTVCIHPAGNNVNICEIYDVPGVPRFAPMGIPGMDDEQTAFVDAITSQKGKDCARRSETNFSTTLQWVYGVKNSGTAIPGAPQVAANRVGAWPEALEIAFRIRNLEMMVNRPPITEAEGGICRVGGGCTWELDKLDNSGTLPVNERPIKAFLSAYKALGGQLYQGNTSELKQNLILYELGASEGQVDFSSGDNLSNFLIPAVSNNPYVPKPRVKFYLDLKIMPINYVNFFTAFVANQGDYSGINTDAECKGSKTAIPVPGYIFGFAKNPEILTYYAVKAETKYIGLLYPFTATDGIPMKAYAAAKPFGGRIGPHTFDTHDPTKITARGDQGDQFQSGPFISGFDVSTVGAFQPGYPIPTAGDFWVKDATQVIGGTPSSGQKPRFGVPNILYDYIPGAMANQANPTTSKLQVLKNATSYSEAYTGVMPAIGVYNKKQFETLSMSFQPIINNPTPDNVTVAIEQARQPTRYDALNYLIPTIDENNAGADLETVATIANKIPNPAKPNSIFYYNLYAPLFHTQSLFPTPQSVKGELERYIINNESAVTAFLEAFKQVADNIRARGTTYKDAADGIHDGNAINNPTCKSIAGKFQIFFTGTASDGNTCGIKSLVSIVQKYWSDENANNATFSLYYKGTYAKPVLGRSALEIPNTTLMTAYAPGPGHFADNKDDLVYPYTGDTFKARRNSYSTKFVALGRLLQSSSIYSPYIGGQFPTAHDFSDPRNTTLLTTGSLNFSNAIPTSEISDFTNIDH